MTKLERIGVGVLVVIAIIGYLKWTLAPSTPVVDQWQVAKKAPEVVAIPKEVVTTPLEVFMPAAVAKLNLQVPKDTKVISAVEVKHNLHPQEVVTVVQKDGVVDTFTRVVPYPWLAPEQTGEVAVYYGVANGGQRVGLISVSENLLQVKAFHLGVMASVDTNGSVFYGVGGAYRW